MTTLFRNGKVINVFSERIVETDVLIEDEKIIGIGDYADTTADEIIDCTGKYICPGFIDGHIHIESTMLLPAQFARTTLPHGTTSIVADPHEIANVMGLKGINYMLSASDGLPLNFYFMIPSCVPSTPFEEAYTPLDAGKIRHLYHNPRVLGLAEMMNYPGVIAREPEVMAKINEALSLDRLVDGHAPTLTGHGLDAYLSSSITSDHECSTMEEAVEKLEKGQWIMIREGTAARNLAALLPLFEEPYYHRCLLVTDDRHPSDLMKDGHIDNIVRKAIAAGKKPERVIKIATLNAANRFCLKNTGAIAPGFKADILLLDNLEKVSITDVFVAGKHVVTNGVVQHFDAPTIPVSLNQQALSSIRVNRLKLSDFAVPLPEKVKDALKAKDTSAARVKCHVIGVQKGELLTDDLIEEIDFSKNGGIDVARDILKVAVIERHHRTGHKGIGFIKGIQLKKGAIASTVSHDSHNIIVIGTNDRDMLFAAERIKKIGGGCVFVADGKVIAEQALPVAGLMSTLSAEVVARQNADVRASVHEYGVPPEIEPFMNMAFISLPVIPYLKITTLGLVDVATQQNVSLFAE